MVNELLIKTEMVKVVGLQGRNSKGVFTEQASSNLACLDDFSDLQSVIKILSIYYIIHVQLKRFTFGHALNHNCLIT